MEEDNIVDEPTKEEIAKAEKKAKADAKKIEKAEAMKEAKEAKKIADAIKLAEENELQFNEKEATNIFKGIKVGSNKAVELEITKENLATCSSFRQGGTVVKLRNMPGNYLIKITAEEYKKLLEL